MQRASSARSAGSVRSAGWVSSVGPAPVALTIAALAVACLSAAGFAQAGAVGYPTGAQDTRSAPPEAGSTPLLEALAYVPAAGDAPPSLGFIDWAALKVRHGGAEVTGDSPSADREALLRDIAANEALTVALDPLDRDVLDADDPIEWPADWGWDRTDLEWELHVGPTTILRFEDGPDSDGLQAQAEQRGLVREPNEAPDASAAADVRGEGDVVYRSPTANGFGMTVTEGGRTVVVERGGTGEATAARARMRDPLEVAASPYGRVATSLGRPLVTRLYLGQSLCTGTGQENALLRGTDARMAASVGRLQPYEVLGVGYSGTGADGGILGHYVFDYARARQAEADLVGRRALVRQSFASDTDRGVGGFRLSDAAVSGRRVIVDVEGAGQAGELFERLAPGRRGEPALLAICGPPPSDEPLTRQPSPDDPIFVGPASLALSGGAGIHRWGEARFGADEVRLQATLHAGADPCALWLTASDQASPGTRLASQTFTAAPGSATRNLLTLPVDYATASMTIETSCERWSLRLEPLEDPELTLTLRERSYPVRGATIAEIAPQTNQAQGGWAAYTTWETDWHYMRQEDVDSCTVTSGVASLASTITYPRWDPPADADPRAVAEWRRFMESLTTHKLGHVTIALQGADAIDELLDGGLSAPTCQQVERDANRAALRTHEHFDRLNASYDRETDHGRTQGSTLR